MTSILDPVVSGATSYPLGGFRLSSATDRDEGGVVFLAGARVVLMDLTFHDRRAWLGDQARAQLDELLQLEPQWDGHRAKVISIAAVRGAVESLFRIADEVSLAPQFFPLPDGGVQYEWHVGGESVEVEVDGSGVAYALATDRDGNTLVEGSLDSAVFNRQVGSLVRRMSLRAMSRSWPLLPAH